jgi:hypothetical protein
VRINIRADATGGSRAGEVAAGAGGATVVDAAAFSGGALRLEAMGIAEMTRGTVSGTSRISIGCCSRETSFSLEPGLVRGSSFLSFFCPSQGRARKRLTSQTFMAASSVPIKISGPRLLQKGVMVRIVGPCVSACTLVLSYVPRRNACVMPNAYHWGSLRRTTQYDRDGQSPRKLIYNQLFKLHCSWEPGGQKNWRGFVEVSCASALKRAIFAVCVILF